MWIIVIDHICDRLAGEKSRIGVGEYPDMNGESVARVINDHRWTHAFRILDADREVYYEGLTDTGNDGDANTRALAKALAFAEIDAGGTDIEYRRLGETEWHPL